MPTGRSRSRGFTLIEVVMSLAIMSIVVSAIGSMMVLATRALPNPDDPASETIAAGLAMSRIVDDLRYATRLIEASPTAIEFEVPDRDADLSPEVIRYEWSGVSGDPLSRSVNGGSHEIVLERARGITISYTRETSDLVPTVLLVVSSASLPSSQDAAKRTLIEGFGFGVDIIDQGALASEFDAALADAQLAYVSEQVDSTIVGTKLTSTARGVVCEEGALFDELGISTSAYTFTDDHVHVTDDTHEITTGLGTDHLTICSSAVPLVSASGTLAPGLTKLAESHGAADPTLSVVEEGGTLVGGGASPGRRVALPWGTTGFDVGSLDATGQLVMRRAIEWAGRVQLVSSIRVTIDGVSGSASRVERRVSLANRPEVPLP